MVIHGLDVRKPREGDYILCNFIDEKNWPSYATIAFIRLIDAPQMRWTKIGHPPYKIAQKPRAPIHFQQFTGTLTVTFGGPESKTRCGWKEKA